MYRGNDNTKETRRVSEMKARYSTRKEVAIKQEKDPDANPENQDEVLLNFPTLETVDNSKLGYYLSILNRNDEGVDLDDLDRLQPELELLLSAAAVRLKTLQTEVNNITAVEDKAAALVINNKKRKLNDGRVSKSMKDLSKVRDRESSTKMDSMSSENETDNSENVTTDTNQPNDSNKVLPKNDTSNKFWALVESFVPDITEDRLKQLEDLIQRCDADMAETKIPPLGPHYTTKWSDEDIDMEKQASTGRLAKTSPPRSPPQSDVSLFKRAANVCGDRAPGPFVQRLVSALIEEPGYETCNKITDENEAAMYLSKLPLYHTTACFERRIRRKLEVVGLLDSDNEDTDEILNEIKKCEEELKNVAAQNKQRLKCLLEDAKLEMKKQEIKNKIKVLDAEVIETYRKSTAAKLKKKQLQPKEKEQAWKLLKDREALVKSLAAIR